MSGSYQQYKNDTSAFTTWLGRAAAACGYKSQAKKVPEDVPPPVPDVEDVKDSPSASPTTPANPQRLKGKARKQAKQAQAQAQAQAAKAAASKDSVSAASIRTVTYEVTTQDLLAQIEAVSTSQIGIHMPPAIKQLLNRAIEARQRCSQWYESTKRSFDEGGHRYFIKVLKDALTKLAAPDTTTSQRSNGKAAPLRGKDKSVLELQNRFSHLEVEDVDESFHLSATDVALYTKPKASKSQDAVDVYELELEKAMEDAFAIFCFFEDLHGIQNRVIRTWKKCASGSVDVVLATVATHAAVEAIRRAEKEICGSLLPDGEVDDCYEALSGKLAFIDSATHHKSESPHTIDSAVRLSKPNGRNQHTLELNPATEVTPFDNFIFRPAARTLFKFLTIAAMAEENNVDWPAPIPPLRCQYVGFPEEADRPENRKLQQEDEFLTQVLLDLQFPDLLRKHVLRGGKKAFEKSMKEEWNADKANDFLTIPQEDIFTKTLRPVWMQGKLSVTSAVTAQLLLDIVEVCKQESAKYYKQLKFATHHASGSFKFNIRPDGAMETGDLNWPRSGTSFLMSSAILIKNIEISKLGAMKNIRMQVTTKPKMYTYSNSPAWLKAKWDSEGGRPPPEVEAAIDRIGTGFEFISPEPDDEFAMRNNPMYSGSVMLRLLLEYYSAGLSLANHHLSIFVVAHLYNALRRLHLLDGLDWPVMERIMVLHKRALFADVVPTTTDDMADRLSYRLDYAQKQKVAAAVDRYRFKEDPGASVLRSFLEDDCAGDRALWSLEQYMQKPGGSSTDVKRAVTQSSKTIAGRKRQNALTPNAFIDNLEETLDPLLKDLSIDYIRLTKRCRRLLEDFRKMWNLECQMKDIDVKFDSYFCGKNTNDIGHLGVAHQALQEAKSVRALGIYTYRPGDGEEKSVKGSLNDDPDDPWRHGLGLMTVAKVFKNLITKEKDISFTFPYASHDTRLLDSVPDNGIGIDNKRLGKFTKTVSTAAELREVLSSNMYAVVNFYTDYDGTHGKMRFPVAELAWDHALPGFLAIVIANMDDMNTLAAQYCKEPGKETFVFFKEGKQVAVNGKTALHGEQKEALRAAVQKLGALAKKRAEENSAPTA